MPTHGMEFRLRARRAELSLGADKIELYAHQRDLETKANFAANKLELVEWEEFVKLQPFVAIEMHEAQILMDDLWDAGVRPTEARGSAGAMKAVLDHLDDMRKIAFKKLGIVK